MNIRHVVLTSFIFALAGCGLSKEFSKTSSNRAKQERARAIYDAISLKLDTVYPDVKGTVWSQTKIALDTNWIVQGPNDLWGATPDRIPETLDCDPSQNDCDPSFKRQLCEVSSDCRAVSTRCVPLNASVYAFGQTPTKMCLGMGDDLLDRFYDIAVSADHELDIVSLSTPSGRFYTAMINAFSVLSQKPSTPSIRMLFSGYDAGLPNILNSTDKIMKQIGDDVFRKAPDSFQKLRMNIAWLADGKVSWNHAKVIVADGNRALQGGHNYWDDKYLSPRTIFDLSMEYRGEGAAEARNFVNTLWDIVGTKRSSFPIGLGKIDNFTRQATDSGTIDTITVGRLGSYGPNVSDTALQSLIDNATTSVSLIQQDVYNFFVSPLPLFQTFVFKNIVNAAARGVKVEMVLSNQHAFFGYTTVDGEKEYKTFLDALVFKLRFEQHRSKSDAEALACERIVVAPFRFSRLVDYWPGKKDEQPGLHTKFVMVDDAAFYLGSHNLYPADLQEFGNIVTDAGAAEQIRAAYWEKVWQESLPTKMACPY